MAVFPLFSIGNNRKPEGYLVTLPQHTISLIQPLLSVIQNSTEAVNGSPESLHRSLLPGYVPLQLLPFYSPFSSSFHSPTDGLMEQKELLFFPGSASRT